MKLLVLVPTEPEREGLADSLPAGVSVALCGLGPPAAALGAARALSRAAYDHCLLVGIAGTRDRARAPLRAVVTGTTVLNEAVGAGQGEDFVALGDMGLGSGLDLPPDELPLTRWPVGHDPAGVLAGVIGTVAAASATTAEAATRRRSHPEVLIEEMEGHAVALACREAGVPLSIVRAVSNVAGERGRSAWDIDGALASLSAVLTATLGQRAAS